MNLANQIFGLASTAAFVRSRVDVPTYSQHIIESMMEAMGGHTEDGTYAYNTCINASGLDATPAFTRSCPAWVNLEDSVALIDPNTLSKIGISAFIYGFSTYSSIESKYAAYYINKYEKIINPTFSYSFTEKDVEHLYSTFSLSELNAVLLNSTSGDSKIVNYNWFDAEPLFFNPAIDNSASQLIKDIENQYYYLSGELIYNNLPTGISPCIKDTVSIHTSSGIVLSTSFRVSPCYDTDSYVGPVSGIKFFRIFNDGPGTSGYFDSLVQEQSSLFDKTGMDKRDYLSNNYILYSFNTDTSGNLIYLKSGVNTDSQGFYCSAVEYGYGKTNLITTGPGCDWSDYYSEGVPFMRMHQGDDRPKLWVDKSKVGGVCKITSGYYNWTGWKFANFELADSWTGHFSNIETNPKINSGRLLKRALNLNNSTDPAGNPITPYLNVVDIGNGSLSCDSSANPDVVTYIGPPQLNGSSSLPGFAFYQTFDNVNFSPTGGLNGELISITVRPAVSTSVGNGTLVTDLSAVSQRTLEVSSFDLFKTTGIRATFPNTAKINIYHTINSTGMSGYDDVFKQALSMGDCFGNQVTISSGPQSNAGFFYTGYAYYISGTGISQADLFSQYSNKLVGNKYSKIDYIDGYISPTFRKYTTSKKIAQIITGDTSSGVSYANSGEPIYYYYLNDDEDIGATNMDWKTAFAPIPTVINENLFDYKPIYKTQNVENYLPRYVSGPYLSYKTRFLYPHAKLAYDSYVSNANGFPKFVKYIINVKEETVREVFLTSGISFGTIKNHKILRADKDYNVFDLKTQMVIPFTSIDGAYSREYNFNANKTRYPTEGGFFYSATSPRYVDSKYVPNTDYCPQLSLNSTIYQGSNDFILGVKQTGILKSRIFASGTSKKMFNVTALSTEPIGGGTYWGYKGRTITGKMEYLAPVFDLSTMSLNIPSNFNDVIYNGVTTDAKAFTNNGSLRNGSLYEPTIFGFNGKDPLFYEYMGGRSGANADLDGGYHSKGIIGDNWYHVNIKDWGVRKQLCDSHMTYSRWSKTDGDIFLLSLNTTGMDIFTRGLSYYPYYLNWQYRTFNASPVVISGASANRISISGEDFFAFDLRSHFPLKNADTGLYNYTGLDMSFNRDVELFISGSDSIIPSGCLIIDGEQFTNPNWIGEICPSNYVDEFIPNTGIFLGAPGRSNTLSTFKLVASGKKININLSGIKSGSIGFKNKTNISIRPRKNFGAVDYSQVSQDLILGDPTVMDGFRFIDNGTESKFSLANNGKLNDLVGKTFVYTTVPKVDLLLPEPGSDFDTVLATKNKLRIDSLGNKIYGSNPSLDYWKIKNPNLDALGFREVSRISFEIVELNAEYDEIPYQSLDVIVPSGECSISGTFSYTGQSESAIVSEGMVLSGNYGSSSISGLFEPYFVSNTLSRIPEGIYKLPSGSGIHSVLEAPSLMRSRKNFFTITGNDLYINTSPSYDLHYNRYIWPAISDLGMLNPELVYEQIPPDDGTVFLRSNLIFSAAQGQGYGTGNNPSVNIRYTDIKQYMFLDSTSTNALYNTGKCLVSVMGTKTYLDSGDLTGILASENSTISFAKLSPF